LLTQFEALLSSKPEDREKNITALETACTNFKQAIDKGKTISTTDQVKQQRTQLTELANSLMKTTEECIQNLKKEESSLGFAAKRTELKNSAELKANDSIAKLQANFENLSQQLDHTTSLPEKYKKGLRNNLNEIKTKVEDAVKKKIEEKASSAKYHFKADSIDSSENANKQELAALKDALEKTATNVENFQKNTGILINAINPIITLSVFDKNYQQTLFDAKQALEQYKAKNPTHLAYQEVYDQMSAIITAKEKRLQNTSYAIIALTVFTLGIGYAIAKWRHDKKAEA